MNTCEVKSADLGWSMDVMSMDFRRYSRTRSGARSDLGVLDDVGAGPPTVAETTASVAPAYRLCLGSPY